MGPFALSQVLQVIEDAQQIMFTEHQKLVSTFLEGLGQRLNKCVFHFDIRPGFVKTPMTSEFDQRIIVVQT